MLEQIQKGINEILTKTGDDWFIIIEEPNTEKFVQFTYDGKDGLIFDLPRQALTETELVTAQKELGKYSIYLETAECFNEPGGHSVGQQQSFMTTVEKNADLAAYIAYSVFKNIYGFSDDTALSVTIAQF